MKLDLSQSNYILECKNLGKTYQDADTKIEVLKQIDFQVKPGQTVAVLGRSGSGKTTLINLLGGLELPTKGQVLLGNNDLSKLSDRKRGLLRNRALGLIFQFHHLLPEFSALENAAMPLLIRGETIKNAQMRAKNILQKVGLANRLTHKPSQLSGGERQRVAIARAMVTNPRCILADEPTGNLDNENADLVYGLIVHLAKDLGTSFVVVTHDLTLANKMDRMVKLDNGLLHEI